MKHRTQILLDDWQYQTLREEAVRLKVSFSHLIRTAVDRLLQSAKPRKRSRHAISRFAGIITDRKASLTNRRIDEIVYDTERK
ncbi:MAG: hypothetical protein HY543_06190 [Deltaproteobacteria bacterium]|nr:hypothetical protein [Deltaproteobacteria bacterium]